MLDGLGAIVLDGLGAGGLLFVSGIDNERRLQTSQCTPIAISTPETEGHKLRLLAWTFFSICLHFEVTLQCLNLNCTKGNVSENYTF